MKVKKLIAEYFTRKRLLTNAIFLLLLSTALFVFKSEKEILGASFMVASFIYFALYLYFWLKAKKS
ncbi:hypothetical protein RM553_10265 [Zunongwangia sp. F363]|uniref:Uncharacterized protein n=1 Tax=Autumnicola tepida TaxID=3075595 RepID=A0ABU3CA59_9FLAO|nr:hypothetical protein [Zunongwangia sp. F363]MDT0643211.1 hypothetical protein [Zunongwangia sp. F363]